jgi:hypothetical protein
MGSTPIPAHGKGGVALIGERKTNLVGQSFCVRGFFEMKAQQEAMVLCHAATKGLTQFLR